MTDFLDPTDIYCRLKPRKARRVTSRRIMREFAEFRRTRFGALAECYLAACALFLAAVLAWRAVA